VVEITPLSLTEIDEADDAFAALVEQGMHEIIARVLDAQDFTSEDLATLAPADIDQITAEWEAYVVATLLPFLVASMQSASAETVAALTGAIGFELPFLDEPADVQRYLAQAQNRLVGIGNELWFNARSAIAQGLDAGEAIPAIAERVREAANVTTPRARVIARTESHGARNAVNVQTVRRVDAAFGISGAIRRRWQAANDERTRETHRRADGQEVALNEPFRVGRASLDFPGDPSGPPDEVINCRCAPITVIDTDALDVGQLSSTVVLNAAATEEHTGAMIALALTEDDAQRLALDGYEDVEELHLTLAYLGEGADWRPEQQTALIDALKPVAEGMPGALEGDAFGVNHWNPQGDEPCWVLGIGGEGLADFHSSVWEVLQNQDGPVPENHTPWIPHVCLAYAAGAEPFDAMVERTGPITFDRLRIAFAGENTYLPLGATLAAAAFQEDEDMPWSIVEGDERCEAGEFAVVKDEDNELEGCHATEEDAQAQVAALNAAEAADNGDDAEPVDSGAPGAGSDRFVPVSGGIVLEGRNTGDRREFEAGALTWQDAGETASLEIPLGYQFERGHGPMGSDKVARVGRLDSIERQEGGVLFARGVIDLATKHGRDAALQMGTREEPGTLAGVSIVMDEDPDGPGLTVEYQMPEGCDADSEEFDEACMMFEREIVTEGARIRAVDLVDIPAFAEARLYLDAPLTVDDLPAPEDDDEALTASAFHMAIPDLPPADWFAEPVDEPDIGAITITDEGRIFGYLAPKRVAHRGYRDKRVEVPTGNVDYGIWMNRVTIVDDGSGGFQRLATGPITMNCGHAPTDSRIKGAARREHYDNSCSVVATVRAGENAKGVWIAGAVLPDVSADQVRRMMTCQLSGDWGPHREKPGKRELAAALLVPVPGFPKRNFSHLGVKHGVLDRIAVPVRFGTHTVEQQSTFGTKAAADRIAESIGRDRASRVHQFAAKLEGILKGD
jgi:2'-5' RNA ligase